MLKLFADEFINGGSAQALQKAGTYQAGLTLVFTGYKYLTSSSEVCLDAAVYVLTRGLLMSGVTYVIGKGFEHYHAQRTGGISPPNVAEHAESCAISTSEGSSPFM